MKSSNIRFEKDIRKKTVIFHKEEYYELYRLHGEIKKLGEDWNTLDIKSLEEYYKKVEGMRDIKRIVLKKHVVTKKRGRRMETITKYLINTYKNFRNETDEERKAFCLLKRGKQHPTELLNKNNIKVLTAAKKQDVNNLMKKQFGDDWSLNEEFRWYKDLVHNETHPEQESDHEDFACDCNEEEANNILV
ncbi:unnamed protein product [Euphydryas editha]|uniref:Uncharacterized protein n=1 Tax=Euphydryas editha TaxID=104508 RepID=A0AAU9U7H9_EUPED|nr:unnamed protein product [Euphydryas editha]